jgi:S-DNA-T family DNA segregation ATPase FtsK/SpoIIIE
LALGKFFAASRPMNFLNPSPNKRLNEAKAVVCLALGLWLLLSLVSYYPLDNSFNSASSSGFRASNLGGPWGAHVADLNLQVFGFAAYLFPLLILALGWKWVRSAQIDAPWIKVVGWTALVSSISAAFGMIPSWHPIGRVLPASGLIGMLLADSLVARVNDAGAILIVLVVGLISLYLISSFSLENMKGILDVPRRWIHSIAARWRAWRIAATKRAQEKAAERKAEARAQIRQQKLQQRMPSPVTPGAIAPDLQQQQAAHTPSGMDRFFDEEENDDDRPPFDMDDAPPIVPLMRPQPIPAPVPAQNTGEDFDEIPIHTLELEDDDEPAPFPPQHAAPAAVAGPKTPVKSARKFFTLPPTNLLTEPEASAGFDKEELHDIASRIKAKFEEFNVRGNVTQINPGPVVTTYEFKPEAGVKYSRITGLRDDLCLGLQAESLLIERIPGKPTVGIEVPNSKREVISLREILESPEFQNAPSKMSISLGKDINGRIKTAPMETMPHLLIAGSTGSGKSVMLNALIMSVLYKATPDDVRMIMVDPKRLELGLYEGIPHLLTPVITDAKKATNALRNAVIEMENRLKLLASHGVRNIDQFNKKMRQLMSQPRSLFDDQENNISPNEELKPLPYILIIIDELADLMMVERAGVEESVTRLAQMARAVGMHLVLATQRPSVDVITGLIKANFPSRISFRVATRVDSRTVLDVMGAEHLLGKGDMLYLAPGTSRLVRVHGAYVSEAETNIVVEYWKQQAEPEYDKSYLMAPPSEDGTTDIDGEEGGDPGNEDPAYQDAVRVVCEMGKASTSILQRRLRLGYGRAARMLDVMQRDGIIGPPDGSRPREVLKKPDWLHEIDAQLR